jgi:acyl-coenzyme A synthetase/AMP-(fatty) acid ligase
VLGSTRDKDNYIWITGRVDDVINVSATGGLFGVSAWLRVFGIIIVLW